MISLTQIPLVVLVVLLAHRLGWVAVFVAGGWHCAGCEPDEPTDFEQKQTK